MLWTSFFIAKIKNGSNSVNTGDKITVVIELRFCNSPYDPLSGYQVSLNNLQYFKRYALDKSVTDGRKDARMDRRTDGRTDKEATICSPFGGHKNVYNISGKSTAAWSQNWQVHHSINGDKQQTDIVQY